MAREWFAENRYQDYLYLHGLSVEMAEALAEYVHKRIRAELGFAAEDARDIDEMLNQGYRGSRYSFGYPACPNLADQTPAAGAAAAPSEIGITLTDEDQLDPEQSTSRHRRAPPAGEVLLGLIRKQKPKRRGRQFPAALDVCRCCVRR